MSERIRVALGGNPNAGKTTVFNGLTGSRQHTGNYPGVTVEKRVGVAKRGKCLFEVVDLPGAYSLSASSVDESVARDFLVHERPDVVVDVIDASNLERNLYLAVQLSELGLPLVLAFNMSDVAASRVVEFDLAKLSELLGVCIVPTVGNKERGLSELLDAVHDVAEGHNAPGRVTVDYGAEIEAGIAQVSRALAVDTGDFGQAPLRWVALRLLEDDPSLLRRIGSSGVASVVREWRERLAEVSGVPLEVAVAQRRYRFISRVCQSGVRSSVARRSYLSDRVDGVLAHRVLGLPIFLGLMYLVFQFTFTLGEYPMAWLEGLFAWLGESASCFQWARPTSPRKPFAGSCGIRIRRWWRSASCSSV